MADAAHPQAQREVAGRRRPVLDALAPKQPGARRNRNRASVMLGGLRRKLGGASGLDTTSSAASSDAEALTTPMLSITS